MRHVTLHTPRDPALSSGIVSWRDRNERLASRRPLRERTIIATVTPYAARYVRLTPSVRNLPAEIDAALCAVHALG